ncbi:MAG TPA: hypothetical protein VKZ84_08300 [Bacteriovoracaceae bacterium]|nr:hypothetical protein [Bacteriovoracaceae bacterium]
MKYTILSLFIFATLTACSEPRQEEEAASYNNFFMSRGERAKSIKDQNYSVSPSASPVIEESRIQKEEQSQEKEQENLPDNVIDGIVPEAQEDRSIEPSVNGATETEYLEDQRESEPHHLDAQEDIYFEEEQESEENFVTPEDVRSWED